MRVAPQTDPPDFDAWIDQLLENQYIDLQGWIPESTLDALYLALLTEEAAGALRSAQIGRGAEVQRRAEIRSDKIAWWPDEPEHPAQKTYLAYLKAWWLHLNQTCFTAIQGGEFHSACYPPGAFYARHLDQFRGDRGRVISVITYLNRDWTEADGGQLVLYTARGPISILPQWGRTVMFRSEELEHEVLPGKKERRSITGWLR